MKGAIQIKFIIIIIIITTIFPCCMYLMLYVFLALNIRTYCMLYALTLNVSTYCMLYILARKNSA